MRPVIRALVLLLFLSSVPAAAAEEFAPGVPVIVMTHPTRFQVMNIVEMFEKDILPLEKMCLLGIYHEDELVNTEEAEAYRAAFRYVEEKGLSWVRFRRITGRVALQDLFRENHWTSQIREIFASASGIIFTGGMDIPPAVYGQATSILSEPTTPARSLFEVSFLFHLLGGGKNPGFTPMLAARPGLPVLAICLGLQSMNVACGGTLVQDIPTEVYGQKTVEEVLASDPESIHSSVYLEKLYPNDAELKYPFHRIRLGKESLFVRKMGFSGSDLPCVATAHHQAVGKLGLDLRVTATSLDGRIVEALEHARYANVLAIQFHPERHTLFRKGLRMRARTDAPLDFNPRAFLKANSPSWEFHLAIWKWFAEAVSSGK
ncbi:MAG: gamma-glutamyl-gamma-aminobutyrate hydrolase family protein [Acidobacteria bacterium]|jgi:putative glutamine amidotransferase|nr:gamma-glutamyl-gamma-aminobutyrate hydrolase family protein [Acidobacteriota bacterium]